jgi:hypothetical protein
MAMHCTYLPPLEVTPLCTRIELVDVRQLCAICYLSARGRITVKYTWVIELNQEHWQLPFAEESRRPEPLSTPEVARG